MYSNQFMTDREIFDTLDFTDQHGGTVVYYDRQKGAGKISGEGHTFYYGETGAGKTRRGDMALLHSIILSEDRDSFLAVDSKHGELHEATSGLAKARGYDVRVINYANLLASEGFNPLRMAYQLHKSENLADRQRADDLLGTIAYALYPDVEHTDPFWNASARELLTAALYTLFYEGEETQIHIPSLYSIVTKGREKIGVGGNTLLKQYASQLPNTRPDKLLYATFINSPNDTAMSIQAVFLNSLSKFITNHALKAMSSSDTLNILAMDDSKPLAIYIILPDQTADVYASQAAMLTQQLILHFIHLAHQNPNNRLRRQLHVIIEELGSTGACLPNLNLLMQASRSRGIRIHGILQDEAQLTNLYGEAKASAIKNNANTVLFRVCNYQTLKQYSDLCGYKDIVLPDGSLHREALITPTHLLQMDVGQALVMFGKHKMVMQLPDYTEIYGDYSHLEPVVPQVHLSAPTDIFELKLRAESSERHFSPSFPFSSETATRPVNVDSILKTLDERIKDIEEEERKLEAGSNKKYHLVLATRPSDPLSLAGELTKLCPSITRTNARRLVSKENSTLVAGLNSKKARELAHKLNLATDALILVEED